MSIQYIQHQLPSRGLLYDGKIPEGKVGIRKLTAREEAILFNQGLSGTARIAQMIRACTQLPPGFDADDLLVTDRHAILLALRVHSLGPNYHFHWTCGECRTPNEGKVNLVDELEEKVAPDDLSEPILAEMKEVAADPVVIGLRFLRGRDEERVAKRASRVRMQGAPDPSDPGYLHTLALHIVQIGDTKPNQEEAIEFVRGLPIGDSVRLRRTLEKHETGIDTRVYLTCARCGHETYEGLPMDVEFFRPALD